MKQLFKTYELWGKTRVSDGLGGWVDTDTKIRDIDGVLSMLSGDSDGSRNKLMVESTHIFLCLVSETVTVGQTIRKSGDIYRIDYIDNPVEADSHLELYLKRM